MTKNYNQWTAKAISEEDAGRFVRALKDLGIAHPVAHTSYLINLASPESELWKKIDRRPGRGTSAG